MNAVILKEAFDKYFQVSLEAWQHFADQCETITLEKEQVIKKRYAAEKFFYFIMEGSAGIFIWKKNNFVCLDFTFENNFFGDYMSFLNGESTLIETMTLEKSTMLRISKEKLVELSKLPWGQTILRVAAEASFIDKQKQQIDLLTKTAGERYQELVIKFPGIANRTPQKYIASYLGITPQSLSRIRKAVH